MGSQKGKGTVGRMGPSVTANAAVSSSARSQPGA